MVKNPQEYNLDTSPHFSYMILQTRTFNHKVISIGVIFSSYSCSNLFSLHTLAWDCVLQFKLSIMLVSLISQPCFCIFQPNYCYYLSYVYILYTLENLQAKITT